MIRQRGFTLVEVIVALAVVAIALPVLLTTFYQQADNTAYLRDRTMAQMIAANKLTEVRMAAEAARQIEVSKESGSSQFAERDWYWWVDISAAPGVPDFFRIEVTVSAEEDDNNKTAALYTLTGFMSGDFKDDQSSFSGNPGDDENDPANQGNDNNNTSSDSRQDNFNDVRDQSGNMNDALERLNGSR